MWPSVGVGGVKAITVADGNPLVTNSLEIVLGIVRVVVYVGCRVATLCAWPMLDSLITISRCIWLGALENRVASWSFQADIEHPLASFVPFVCDWESHYSRWLSPEWRWGVGAARVAFAFAFACWYLCSFCLRTWDETAVTVVLPGLSGAVGGRLALLACVLADRYLWSRIWPDVSEAQVRTRVPVQKLGSYTV
jgi:hypothetical protein